jgi:hypothetical protein
MNQTGILRVVNQFLNGTTAVGDLYPGTSTNGYPNQPNQYQGQVGAFELLKYSEAQRLSDTATAPSSTLQSGRYQYVQFAADGATYAQGQLLYWKDETKYIVTNVAPSATSANFAGFCIAPVTQGNYWFIQTSGVAYAQFAATASSHTASVGVYGVVNTATVNSLADATADATAGVNKLFVGIAKDAPSDGGLTRIYIKGLVEVE